MEQSDTDVKGFRYHGRRLRIGMRDTGWRRLKRGRQGRRLEHSNRIRMLMGVGSDHFTLLKNET